VGGLEHEMYGRRAQKSTEWRDGKEKKPCKNIFFYLEKSVDMTLD